MTVPRALPAATQVLTVDPEVPPPTGMLIDADDARSSSPARYINHSVRRQNAEYVHDVLVGGLAGIVWVRARQRIATGQEILVSYGRGYWKDRCRSGLQRLIVNYL